MFPTKNQEDFKQEDLPLTTILTIASLMKVYHGETFFLPADSSE